jgi:hypothetical protein
VPKGRTKGRARQLAIDSTLIAIAALGVLAVVYHLWDADFGIPFEYLGPDRSPLVYAPDAPFYLMMAKGALDHGWFLENPSLGFPFGQELYDIPHGLDNLNLLVLQVLDWVFGNPFTAVNVFFVLTFVGISVAAYLVVRRLGVSRLVGATVALLYSFVPYHFARGTAHLLLSAYWMVPVAGLLIVAVTSERPPFTVDAPDDRRGWNVSLRGWSSILWLLACAGLASTGTYYGAIALTLLVPVALVDYLARRRTRVLVSAGIAVAAVLLVMVVNLLPTFVYWAQHGRNEDVVKRGPSETEVNGLKISQLVLPTDDHRIDAFANIQDKSTRFTVIDDERGQQLGAIGAIGFIGVLGAVLLPARSRGNGSRRDDDPRPPPSASERERAVESASSPELAPIAPPGEVLRVFGIATIVAIVVGAVSGFSLIMAGIGLSDIRSWNRVSIFIAFFALTAVGLGLDWVRRRLPDRPWRTPVTVAALAALLVIGVLDQVSTSVVPDYDGAKQRFDLDAAFFRRIERTLPENAAVFNLPYLFFPESGTVEGVGPYDNVRGYLQTDDLNWSWGGVIGGDADWAAGTAQGKPEVMLDRLAAVGFDGLVLDRRGYREEEGLREIGINLVVGPPTFESADGTLAFWDLRNYARAARARLGPAGIRRVREEAFRDHGWPKVRG